MYMATGTPRFRMMAWAYGGVCLDFIRILDEGLRKIVFLQYVMGYFMGYLHTKLL